MKFFFQIIILIFLVQICFGQNTDTIKKHMPLNEDVYLHPIDAVTPYTLKKGECIYGQPFVTFPFPGWAFIGVTNKLTVQLDFTPLTFGPFTELKAPIPSFNFRYRFNKQKGMIPTIGIEAQFIYFKDTLKRFKTPTLTVWENGSYFHIKPSIGYNFKNKFYINLSIGADYIGELIMQNNDTNNSQTKTFTNSWNPNFSIGFDYRPSKWISFHVAYSYGSTFTYLENVPRKNQINYGFRMAPFYKNRFGILRALRLEVLAINGYFGDIHAWQSFSLPVYPAYIYWQWTFKKNHTHTNK